MTVVGDGDFRYELDETWPNIPEGWTLERCSGVAVDSRNRVFVFNRGTHSIAIFDADSGNFLTSWGEGVFRAPHGIFIGPDDSVYLTDRQAHVVTKHASNGEQLIEMGTRDQAQITVDNHGNFGEPFCQPTGVALNDEGKMFVSDGYGNFRIHRFSASGELEHSWGTPGTGPGQFALPHNIALDTRGRVFVADTMNHRVQIFDQDGGYIEEWADDVRWPSAFFMRDEFVFLIEQGIEPGTPTGVTIFELDGKVVTRWLGAENGTEAPHGIALDSNGNIFVAEISEPGEPGHGQRMRKYARI